MTLPLPLELLWWLSSEVRFFISYQTRFRFSLRLQLWVRFYFCRRFLFVFRGGRVSIPGRWLILRSFFFLNGVRCIWGQVDLFLVGRRWFIVFFILWKQCWSWVSRFRWRITARYSVNDAIGSVSFWVGCVLIKKFSWSTRWGSLLVIELSWDYGFRYANLPWLIYQRI